MLKIIFLCIAGFIAAFVDSIAGGGGLISLPAFLIAGIDPHLSLGTNKFASTTAAFTSSIKYAASGKVNFKLLKFLIPFTLTGAIFGVNAVMLVDKKYLSTLVLVLILCVGFYSIFSKSIGAENKYNGYTLKTIIEGAVFSFVIGFYDGFFGPGTGSFLIFAFINVFGFDFINAGGNARILNFVSNITALILFAVHGQINYLWGVPVAVFMITGAKLGTQYALKSGSKVIKPIFITMSMAVAVKMLFNIFIK